MTVNHLFCFYHPKTFLYGNWIVRKHWNFSKMFHFIVFGHRYVRIKTIFRRFWAQYSGFWLFDRINHSLLIVTSSACWCRKPMSPLLRPRDQQPSVRWGQPGPPGLPLPAEPAAAAGHAHLPRGLPGHRHAAHSHPHRHLQPGHNCITRVKSIWKTVPQGFPQIWHWHGS